ncbi:hypothetical protein [Catellatospora chokoriensis]|uniref:Uncharacterized protein n=1 Tax=Catellatospora chokoriensis TaxID=310353 RepID=A0A8J3K438_9ACTN|nr:hypothetical protein [Catellatospora chokoriensis]GIF89958.1 hypothetical protein Cch02nite_34020 [Catellatospora chokoriensis]
MSDLAGGTVRVDRSAAFRANGVWSREGTLPFPLSFHATSAGGVHSVDATAASISELVDLLAAHARGQALVLNVSTNDWLDGDYQQLPLGRIAEEQGVAAEVHDIRWAATRHMSDDLLVMPWSRMPRLLGGWYPYDIEILDVAGPLTSAEVEELVLTVNTHNVGKAPILPVLANASLWFSGHDDCYFSLETTSAELPPLLLARLLAAQAGAALIEAADPAGTREDAVVMVPQPPAGLAAELLGIGGHWVGTVAQVQAGEQVTLALAPTNARWRVADWLPDVMPHELTLDVVAGTWSHRLS